MKYIKTQAIGKILKLRNLIFKITLLNDRGEQGEFFFCDQYFTL